MVIMRTLRAVGIIAVTGAVLVTASPVAWADEIREDQWALRAFESESVWKESKGKGVTVAVIDNGVQRNHPDLAKNVLPGVRLATGEPGDSSFAEDHGTSMASLIAGHGHGAGGQNGVKGLAPDAKILPVDFYEDAASDKPVANAFPSAVRYAVDNDAKVINVSTAQLVLNGEEKKAVEYALRNDVVIVTSSGNSRTGKLGELGAHPGVVTVGAIDQGLKLWRKSEVGPGMTLTAPGTNMRSAGADDQYKLTEGTSNSAAYVSAAVALVRSKYPDLTAGQAVNRLVKTALMPDHVKERKTPDKEYGYGIVRPYSALTKDLPPGPEEGPLEIPKAPSPSVAPTFAQPNQASESGSSTPMALGILGGVGVVGAIAAAVLVVVTRRRRGAHEPPRPHAQQGYGYPQPPPSHPPGTYQNPPPPGFGPPKQ